MQSLFLVSAATGYGGAERSIEVMVPRLQREFRLTIFAENPLHIGNLRAVVLPPTRLHRPKWVFLQGNI